MSFKIRIEPSGTIFTAADDETVLDAALRSGHVLPYSCRNGSCGTCKAVLLHGQVDYGTAEPPALTDEDRARSVAVLCRAMPRSDLVLRARELDAVSGIEIRSLPARVASMQRLAPDVMRVYLKLPQGQRLNFLPGQYIDILLEDGRRRSFSLANAPGAELLELHIREVGGGEFTASVFGQMREKDMLRIEGPLGTFFLRSGTERPVILIAGGTGFAPAKSIIEAALAQGLARDFHLYWGARARADLYLHELAQSWAARHANVQYTPVLSAPQAGGGAPWQGRTGWVHDAVAADHPDLAGFDVYAAGPPAMIAAVKRDLLGRGLAEERLYYDSFELAADEAVA
jgi:CDP-4-dehydro-6-deoxyglucose reductase